ncbi:MAG: L-histidine N(alpha)-methyltransferase [Bryobacterales bacterium]|nr:L-histidine N(alpha)-methyltransferase [Bryobacteraceae bacterium]MDW8353881.1 L-histidine N(alpha)-methyltransferase [Bryobacterales bacterium]
MRADAERLEWIEIPGDHEVRAFAQAVREGLGASPKFLPCRFFYDEEGSRLFEAICELDEYYLTRAEREILEREAASLAARFTGPVTLIELGSGNAAKTRLLIEAFLRNGAELRYVPVDVCRTALQDSCRALLRDFPPLKICAVAAEYWHALKLLPPAAGRKLVLWLGSNIGNLDRPEAVRFLRCLAQDLGSDDRLLLGIDLRKEASTLERAYDDSQRVTAQFNRNLLARINRELGGHFDVSRFAHRAVYREDVGRIEMYLVSEARQTVRIDALDWEVAFLEGEEIHTENSYKYSFEEIDELADAAGLRIEARWLDRHSRFSLNLLRAVR